MPRFKEAVLTVSMPSDGIVEGYASTFDREPDCYGDVVAKGAFVRTLSEWKNKGLPIPLLYGHNTEDPEYNIGMVVDAYEDEKGLFVRAKFDADNPKAQYARKLAQEGRLYQFSFAYSVRDAGDVEIDGRYAYELRDLDLYEVSLVQIPANQHAVITGVKSADGLRHMRELLGEISKSIDGLEAEGDEQDEPDGGPQPEDNAEEPDGANAEDSRDADADELAALKKAVAYGCALLKALEALNS